MKWQSQERDYAGKKTGWTFQQSFASAVHDMKNSLGMLLGTLDEFFGTAGRTQEKSASGHAAIRGGNIDLIQLLGLYRLEHEQLMVRVDEQFVRDFLEEQVALLHVGCSTENLLEIDCDRDLAGYFDGELVSGVINNILANASRYTQDRILLKAVPEEGGGIH